MTVQTRGVTDVRKLRYLGIRSVQTVVLLWFMITFLFFFFRFMPGSYADVMIQQGASPASVEAFRESWGLNDPLYVQYYRYITNFVTLDFGTSLQARIPVWDYIKIRMFNSFILVAPGVTAAYLLGSLIGTYLGNRRGTLTEKLGLVPTILVSSVPSFFTAILLVIVFGGWLNWFPTSGMMSPGLLRELQDAAWWRPYLTTDFGMHYVLPFTAVVMRYLAFPSLLMRSSIVEVGGQEFAFYHRLTGLPRFRRARHLAKHASLPLITLYPLSMARSIGGLVLIETVFNWNGIGWALVQSVFFRDFPTIQAVFFFIAFFIIVANFVVDVVYSVIDPRISVES